MQTSGVGGERTSRRGAGAGIAALAAVVMATFVLLAVLIESPVDAQTAEPGYEKKEPPLDTPWTAEVGPDNALPEYPRPQMTRSKWQNLNGVWEFSDAAASERPPFGRELGERVLVPYPIESALSGIKRHEDRMFYRRTFTVPENWNVGGGKRLQLHFGAVDYEATVWVNGERIGAHTGGYDEFTFDVTRALKERGKQEIVVGVVDLTTRGNPPFGPYFGGGQPTGKQTLQPGGIFYTASSGIWQTVWMEPVSKARVTRLDTTPDIEDESLTTTVNTRGAEGLRARITAYENDPGEGGSVEDRGAEVGRVTGAPSTELRLPVPNPKLWSPDDPHLYDLEVELLDGRKVVDTVNSYFGMRSVGVEEGPDGKPRMTLNGEFVANMGTLDQGYWPDGVYTAPTDDALKFDLEEHKNLGYNMVRKHIKVEPDRWFYHADKLGLLVWQDMPSFPPDYNPSPADQRQFEAELRQMINEHKSFPSITTWVPYNEGWGELNQETTARVANMVKEQDPSRMVNTHSGVNCCLSQGDTGAGNIYDQHEYQGPPLPAPFDDRATVAGEYGGVALMPEPGHLYPLVPPVSPYGTEPTPERLTARYEELQERMKRGVESCGVSAGVYTEITDVEGEINGMWTYDREVFKPGEENRDRIVAANEAVVAASETATTPGGNFPPGTPGLVGPSYYPFSEGSGTTTEDQGENDADDHDGTLVGPPQWTTGHPDPGLHFDGNDFVDTGAPVLDTTGNYSVAAWVKLDDLNGFQTAVSQDGERTSAFFLQYSGADRRLAFSFVGTRALAPTEPEVGKWYHMVGVRDAASGELKLYLDGDLVDTKSACLGDESSGNTVVGRGKFGGPTDFWKGDLDQVHLYDRTLSDDDVADLYASGE